MNENTPQPTVSVIMLSYNHGRYISRAVESVLMQKTDFPYEILIGDDASSDDSPEILKEYAEKYPDRIRLVLRGENTGTTRNAYDLMQRARGKYLASCESDDYWTDECKLQKQVSFLESHTEYIGCTHPVVCVDPRGTPLKQQRVRWISRKKVYTIRDFRGIVLPGHSCSVVRRNIFLEPKYDYSIMWKANPYIGDRTSTLLFAAQGDFFQLSEPMACYQRELTSGARNLTWTLYHNGGSWLRDELEYTQKLADYAENVLKTDAGFEYYRRELLTSAVFAVIKHNNTENKQMVRDIIGCMKHPAAAVLLVPFIAVRKLFNKRFA